MKTESRNSHVPSFIALLKSGPSQCGHIQTKYLVVVVVVVVVIHRFRMVLTRAFSSENTATSGITFLSDSISCLKGGTPSMEPPAGRTRKTRFDTFYETTEIRERSDTSFNSSKALGPSYV